MQLRAWIFGLLGIVLIVGGLVYYEVRKNDIQRVADNPPLSNAATPNEDIISRADALWNDVLANEKVRILAVEYCFCCCRGATPKDTSKNVVTKSSSVPYLN